MAHWILGRRRISVTLSILVVALAVISVAVTAALASPSGTGSNLNRQQFARHILKTKAAQLMTPPAQAALRMNVAVGYNDSQQTGLALTASSDLTGYSYSTDGGNSFTDGGALPNTPEFVNFGDPWMASDRAGAMYYSTLALDFFNGNLDVAVAKSGDGGKTWGNPVMCSWATRGTACHLPPGA